MAGWLRGYGLMVRWEWTRMLAWLPVLVAIQAVLGGGTVLGFALLLPSIDSGTAAYLATGGPLLALAGIGLAVVPGQVSELRARGTFDFMQSLPLSPLTYPIAMVTVLIAVALPGVALSLGVAVLRFHFVLHPSALVIPVIALVGLTTTSIGFMVALLTPNGVLASLAGNLMLFFTLLFSPINYPADRLPGWLAAVHRGLPIQSMADLFRGTLTGTGGLALGFVVVAGWCVVALASAAALSTRRA